MNQIKNVLYSITLKKIDDYYADYDPRDNYIDVDKINNPPNKTNLKENFGCCITICILLFLILYSLLRE